MALQPEIESLDRMFAHSERLALPTITAPAARSRATNGASRLVTLSASARLPAVVGSVPAVSILSLIRIGIPWSGPRARRLRSSDRAWSIAVGSTAMTALSRGFSRLIRASAALVFAVALASERKTGARSAAMAQAAKLKAAGRISLVGRIATLRKLSGPDAGSEGRCATAGSLFAWDAKMLRP